MVIFHGFDRNSSSILMKLKLDFLECYHKENFCKCSNDFTAMKLFKWKGIKWRGHWIQTMSDLIWSWAKLACLKQKKYIQKLCWKKINLFLTHFKSFHQTGWGGGGFKNSGGRGKVQHDLAEICYSWTGCFVPLILPFHFFKSPVSRNFWFMIACASDFKRSKLYHISC